MSDKVTVLSLRLRTSGCFVGILCQRNAKYCEVAGKWLMGCNFLKQKKKIQFTANFTRFLYKLPQTQIRRKMSLRSSNVLTGFIFRLSNINLDICCVFGITFNSLKKWCIVKNTYFYVIFKLLTSLLVLCIYYKLLSVTVIFVLLILTPCRE